MLKIRFFITIFLLYLPNLHYSQVKPTFTTLNTVIEEETNEFQREIDFKKARSFFVKKEWDSTLTYSIRALSTTKNKEIINYCHFFRGYCFREKRVFKEAQKEMLLISHDFKLYPFVNIDLGKIYLELKIFKKAIHHFNEAEKKPLPHNKDYKISVIYSNLGICYLHLNDFITSEHFFFKSLKLKEKEKDLISLNGLYTNIANLYYMQYKDQQAIPYFEKAYALSKHINHFETKKNAAQNMSAVEENRGNYKKALEYRKESAQWKDSLNNQNKIWAVADLEKKFAVEQKQKQIKVLEVENKLKNAQRNGLFFAAVGLLLILTAGVYLYAQKVKNGKTILRQKNKLDELNATKDQLFSIVSHDLRSSVNALKTSNTKLSSTLETKNYDELNHLIIQNSTIANGAYTLLDNLLHWAMLQTKQLYFQKESIHLYSIVQQIEHNYKPLLLDKAITFENSVSKNSFIFVDLDSLKIVLRNLLDNAIKFSNENSKISFYTQETNPDFCELVIQDNGIGMSESTIQELLADNALLAKKNNTEIIGTGLGLQLCKQMIKKNGGTLAIESELHAGTKMILTFPKTKNNG
ncbi:tetratricopeptide repeat-containing sensor histidine kinase [Flavobacterium tructae]|uniref:histidine kinase n=1 Tax=Flavobacterium tructae TaxID=1114873 RepID=A0A1S1J9G6_9FLAO|nr:tetratricopeptide repeat-containing sensor histidine kinase [Flavobacterium tructae]OHT46149.1 histidine kinase [Flavobacterium tructae]OXB22108.1 histidine kinase [Flavobacterium tructae]